MLLPLCVRERRLVLVLAAAVALFVANNVLLAQVNARWLGTSPTGAVTMACVAWLVLAVGARGVPPVVYAAYGLLGVPSHLLAGDPAYVLYVVLVVVAALLFDWLLALGRYRPAAIVAAFPAFVLAVQAGTLALDAMLHPRPVDLGGAAWSLLRPLVQGWAGIVAGVAVHRLQRRAQTHAG